MDRVFVHSSLFITRSSPVATATDPWPFFVWNRALVPGQFLQPFRSLLFASTNWCNSRGIYARLSGWSKKLGKQQNSADSRAERNGASFAGAGSRPLLSARARRIPVDQSREPREIAWKSGQHPENKKQTNCQRSRITFLHTQIRVEQYDFVSKPI